MTQYALSEAGDIPQTTLVSIKRKRCKDVGVANIHRICQAFGITLVEFFDSPLFGDVTLDNLI